MSTSSAAQITGFPNAGEPLIDPETGVMTRPWQRFFANIWNKLGGANGLTSTIYILFQNGALNAYQSVTGTLIGSIPLITNAGQPAIAQTLYASPQVLSPAAEGTMMVESGQVEISRDNGANWYIVGLTGGAYPLLTKDSVRVTWYNVKHKVTFFPS